ncbi:MAG: TOBE domain-containing protein, partial [Oscillospiraceae bacterium]|nr:TOBE domain-containing protein [Oscillospiraceae bacterium]
NEPKNAFVAAFIGESNIIDGIMNEDYMVTFAQKKFACLDKGFAQNEPVDVVVRPEDLRIVPPEEGQICGVVESVVFKGVHYEMKVHTETDTFMIQSTLAKNVNEEIGLRLMPDDIHIMHKTR